MVINTDDTSQLWKASATVGLAYGAMFGLCPIISLEWFGLGTLHVIRSRPPLMRRRSVSTLFSKLGHCRYVSRYRRKSF
jgi:hypothetical protein